MPGLHIALLAQAEGAGIPLALGRSVPWLTGRGHLHEIAAADAPPSVLDTLAMIHSRLGGDAVALGARRRGNPPTPDLVHTGLGCFIEVDEVQHFTTARAVTLDLYPKDAPLGFDVDEYKALVGKWRSKGDRAYAHKVSADFPFAGGRQAQRAYNDALRDLLAPVFTGLPLIRIPVPDRSLAGALVRLEGALARLG